MRGVESPPLEGSIVAPAQPANVEALCQSAQADQHSAVPPSRSEEGFAARSAPRRECIRQLVAPPGLSIWRGTARRQVRESTPLVWRSGADFATIALFSSRRTREVRAFRAGREMETGTTLVGERPFVGHGLSLRCGMNHGRDAGEAGLQNGVR